MSISQTVTAITAVCNTGVEGETLDEVAGNWAILRQAHRELGVLVDDYALDAGDRLADVDYVLKDGYRLPDGSLVHHAQRSTTHWKGLALLRNLSTDMVEPDTGEVLASVPLKVLTQILPGVASEAAVSSKWLLAGLKNLDVDPDDYRSREWKPVRIMPGVKR